MRGGLQSDLHEPLWLALPRHACLTRQFFLKVRLFFVGHFLKFPANPTHPRPRISPEFLILPYEGLTKESLPSDLVIDRGEKPIQFFVALVRSRSTLCGF